MLFFSIFSLVFIHLFIQFFYCCWRERMSDHCHFHITGISLLCGGLIIIFLYLTSLILFLPFSYIQSLFVLTCHSYYLFLYFSLSLHSSYLLSFCLVVLINHPVYSEYEISLFCYRFLIFYTINKLINIHINLVIIYCYLDDILAISLLLWLVDVYWLLRSLFFSWIRFLVRFM